MKKKYLWKEILGWGMSVLVLIPFYIVVVNSFKTRAEANLMSISLPKGQLQFDNYGIVIEEGKLFMSFINSCIITFASVAIVIILAGLASFILSRNKTKLNRFIYFYALVGVLGAINMVSVIRILRFLQLLNTFAGIILLYVAMLTPFSILVLYNFMSSIPREIDKAAIVDGCGSLRLYFSIIFPLLKPVNATLIALNFMGAWNNFITPLYILNDTKKWPMPLAIFNFYGQYSRDWNLVFATLVLMMIPVLIIYLLAQKYIISGMSAGSIKG